jgi:hypothetical protein
MHQIARTISKMFVIMALLFGSPPPISLLQLRRRPTITLVATAERRDHDPLAIGRGAPVMSARGRQLWWGQAHLAHEDDGPEFQPVQAA